MSPVVGYFETIYLVEIDVSWAVNMPRAHTWAEVTEQMRAACLVPSHASTGSTPQRAHLCFRTCSPPFHVCPTPPV